MENDKFQEFMAEQFTKLFKEVQGVKTELLDFRKDVSDELTNIKEKLEYHDQRFDNLDKLAGQHHEELEKVARQVEQLIVGQESLQDDMDYLLRRSLRKKV